MKKDERKSSSETIVCSGNLVEKISIWTELLEKILCMIYKEEKEGTLKKGYKSMTLLRIIHTRDNLDTLCVCKEKKEKEDPPMLRIALMLQYKDKKNTLSNVKANYSVL